MWHIRGGGERLGSTPEGRYLPRVGTRINDWQKRYRQGRHRVRSQPPKKTRPETLFPKKESRWSLTINDGTVNELHLSALQSQQGTRGKQSHHRRRRAGARISNRWKGPPRWEILEFYVFNGKTQGGNLPRYFESLGAWKMRKNSDS